MATSERHRAPPEEPQSAQPVSSVSPVSPEPDPFGSVRQLVEAVLPDARVVDVTTLGPDSARDDLTEKAAGYGVPRRITVARRDGATQRLVLHTSTADTFGHERRSDRAAEMLLAFDTFGSIPAHVQIVDVGTLTSDRRFLSLVDAGEFYLLTTYAEGQVYAEDLRRIAAEGRATPRDLARCEALARYLVALHAAPGAQPGSYRRAVRDLVGHGEGIFGIIDGYPDDVPGAPPARLEAIERRCVAWRWKLRGRDHRLARTHGDFHPFNIVFNERSQLTLLDTSRGSQGDPADDVTCLAINYVFFALDAPGAWEGAFRALWRRLWRVYLDESDAAGVLDAAAPFLAWRALVLANPRWYPAVTPRARDALLAFAERALDAERFDPDDAERVFA
ncbi:aminoglycoside phosphotransferase family protein [Sorangium sp. So ce1335]|uniref:aminoglycoside phosphotransferase family protein n=1 Tax=Sorangium sp. So ce1335 TaxID=3133335 RepID=UPI003F6427C0